eukprot:m.179702 g.179702  ORF g.179702 m.179702 type:complete len:204 (+) comp39228_c1_seq1:2096-2707(+)
MPYRPLPVHFLYKPFTLYARASDPHDQFAGVVHTTSGWNSYLHRSTSILYLIVALVMLIIFACGLSLLVFLDAAAGKGNDVDSPPKDPIKKAAKWCHREPLLVNFTKLGWNHVVAPVLLEVGQCVGRCGKINRSYHSTFHSRILATWKEKKREEDRRWRPAVGLGPWCVPMKMESATLIVRRQNGNVEKEKMENMIAMSCQCS